ncbi:DNA repair protein RadA [Candidatus Amarolinea aalborgensis]|uniref:DNA repair protein RadA n=1 Tax=Candidatus Amarolinea aalborgensis TaxID=2249329 RepID=UPI003BF98EB2
MPKTAAKAKTVFICQQCGNTSPKWMGRCPDCGEWNTLVETTLEPEPPTGRRGGLAPSNSAPQALPDIPADGYARIPVPMGELSRVLGGGIVPGSAVLIGGDPGIGKSTLLLQMCSMLAQRGVVLYVSGEESAAQIKLRAERLGITDQTLFVLADTHVESMMVHMQNLQPSLVVVDSIQAIYTETISSAAGSVSQVRESAAMLVRAAKAQNTPIFLVGHVTKEGAIAGPRVLEHMVDVVLYLEGERFHTYRLLRGVKNRFGATDEVGVFEMGAQGMSEVTNPSEVFLAERLPNAAGSAIAVTMEGTRPLLVEMQALSSTTSFSMPRRTANGIDFNRLLLLVAVLSKRVGLRLSDQDVFVNVVGGLTVEEPAADLPVAVAIASSYKNTPVAADVALMGEVGLSGELRAISQLSKRLNEAAKLGFKRAIVPRNSQRKLDGAPGSIEVIGVRTISEAIEAALIG